MKTIAIVRVHVKADHTYTSEDFYGYREFDSGVEAVKFLEQEGHDVAEDHMDDDLGIHLIYVKDYAWNRNRQRIAETFVAGEHQAETAYWDKQRAIKNAKRKEEGFVIFKKNDDLTADDYQGALTHSFTPAVKKYCGHGHAGGYLGHQVRRFEHDRIVEEIIGNTTMAIDGQEVDKWHHFGIWLTSNDARHFMDSCEDMTADEFTESFENYVPHLLVKGFLYGLDAHRGTLASTIALGKEYEGRIVVTVG